MRTRRGRLDRGRRQPSIYSRTETVKETRNFSWTKPLLLAILFFGVFYFIFLSGMFSIKSLEIGETKYTNREDISKIVEHFRSQLPFNLNNNILIFSSSKLESEIGKTEGIKSVKVTKDFPSSVRIEIIEKVPVLVWETLQKKYLIDEKGFVVKEYEDRFSFLPTVVDTKNVPVNVGSEILTPQFSAFINEMTKDFNTYSNATITKIEIPETTTEVKVTTDKKWYVLFDTTGTAKNQLINLTRVLQEAEAKKKKLEYVDLRVDNRIFYK
jgi:cell division septal protein FtsQ